LAKGGRKESEGAEKEFDPGGGGSGGGGGSDGIADGAAEAAVPSAPCAPAGSMAFVKKGINLIELKKEKDKGKGYKRGERALKRI
jgi:hypothetical protein